MLQIVNAIENNKKESRKMTALQTSKPILRIFVVLLGALFLLSATMNLGFKIPIGSLTLSFSLPSTSIAGFEIIIAILLLASAAFSNLYVYGGAYILATVGIAEGLLSLDVQGLAREIHETMIPFLVVGWILFFIQAQASYKASKRRQTSTEKNRQIIAILQFFVGGLVTLGGAAFATGGTYPIGTALGSVHLVVGFLGLLGGFVLMTRKPWSRNFLVIVNFLTIAYSAFAESLAEIYAYLPRGINDALVGTIIAIIVSGVILYMIRKGPSTEVICNEQEELEPI
jgi:hypothetical protein